MEANDHDEKMVPQPSSSSSDGEGRPQVASMSRGRQEHRRSMMDHHHRQAAAEDDIEQQQRLSNDDDEEEEPSDELPMTARRSSQRNATEGRTNSSKDPPGAHFVPTALLEDDYHDDDNGHAASSSPHPLPSFMTRSRALAGMESMKVGGGEEKDKVARPEKEENDADSNVVATNSPQTAVMVAATTSDGGEEGTPESNKPDVVVDPETTPASQEMESRQEEPGDEKPGSAIQIREEMAASVSQEASERQEEEERVSFTILERQAIRVAERPCTYFWCALIVSLVLSVVGMVFGDFSVSVDNAGWYSRGTTIADRHTQFLLVHLNRQELFSDQTGAVWDDLVNNVQPGWETDDDSYDDDRRRLLHVSPSTTASQRMSLSEILNDGPAHHFDLQSALKPVWDIVEDTGKRRQLPFTMSPSLRRKLQASSGSSLLQGCDISWYYSDMVEYTHLWPIWRPLNVTEPNFLLRQDALRDLCLSEQRTQDILVSQGLCYGCSDDSKCLPPYSIVFFARLTVPNGMGLDCEELAAAWVELNIQDEQLEQDLVQCAMDTEASYLPSDEDSELPDSCPPFFSPVLIDESYGDTAVLQYTSSIFATKSSYSNIDAMYDIADTFDTGTDVIEGAYDTQWEDFVYILIDESLVSDMGLAMGSAFLTMIAMLVHTRSPFLSAIGLLQIILSFPLAFFIYTFFARLEFFPFLNFIGIFIIFALGADDVFVATDKWRNARIQRGKDASTAEVAAIALPDAAGAMFLTTITTAIAFFGTAICPVAPIRCFTLFVGLLVICDYIMCVVLVFPALCIYDRSRHQSNCCCRCHCCRSAEESGTGDDGGVQKQSLIHRILTRFYDTFHRVRFLLLVLCGVALVLCLITAASMELPRSADVRLLNDDNQFEKNYLWRLNILFDVLSKKGGNSAYVMWGATPADTGDHNNPDSFSQLVLDDSFEPAKEDGQVYLRDFCDRFFANDFAQPWSGEKCPINRFDEWLQDQASSDSPDKIYLDYCGGATSLPLPESDFDACIYNWGQQVGEKFILVRNGKVEIVFFKFDSRVRYDSPHDELEREWHSIEDWMLNEKMGVAPSSVSGMFFTSEDWWWYDTNSSLLVTAFVGAAIAMAVGGAVILLSSRSMVLTVFSTVTISYVLASVTATLVALGWTLGFLESICFAILIGISCDFVIHFSHAYATPPGKMNRHDRTKHALLHMGPSILAAAFTTISAATVMLFTTISFFIKFAVILFMTILQATVGSFLVFLVLVDCFGPAEPTYLVDKIAESTCKKEEEDTSEQEESVGNEQEESLPNLDSFPTVYSVYSA